MGTRTRIRSPRSPFLNSVQRSGLIAPDDLVAFVSSYDPAEVAAADPLRIATLLVRKKLLTKYQAMQLLAGKTQGFLLREYKILEGVRQDRVGLVFLAEDTRSKKPVSIKVLPTERVSDNTILRAFAKEVRLAAQVDHANVAKVYDLDVFNGTHFVVSEHVPGPTLDRVVGAKGPLAANVAAQAVAQVAIALRHAHAKGIYHRDIKPANIALAGEGRVKLLDLGLTHMLENPWAQVTRRISTKEYAEEIDHVAPEQAWGCEPDARSDVYSLGSTFYYLLTGQSPFPGTAAEKMSKRQVQGVPPPSKVRPDLPRELDEIVQTMGAKDPHARYQTATEVVAALHPWLPVAQWVALGFGADELPKPKAAPRPARAGAPSRPAPARWLLVGGIALAAVVAAVAGLVAALR